LWASKAISDGEKSMDSFIGSKKAPLGYASIALAGKGCTTLDASIVKVFGDYQMQGELHLC
jgi:hypothetical protein